MKLNARIKTIVEVKVYDLERFIEEVYGRSIEIVPDQELDNSIWVVDVSKSYTFEDGKRVDTGTLDDYDEKQLDEWKISGKGSFITTILLEDMANRGLIMEGRYNIDVRW